MDKYASTNKFGHGEELIEELLIKCDNPIIADQIVQSLRDNRIASRIHDENRDMVAGAYGADTGLAIYVFEKDFEKANTILEKIIRERMTAPPLCPKCGSEKVNRIEQKNHQKDLKILFVGILLIAIPLVYFAFFVSNGTGSTFLNILSMLMIVASSLVFAVYNRRKANFRCSNCHHRFNHQ